MRIGADIAGIDWHAAKAMLDWQIDAGVTDWSLDAPLDRYGLVEKTIEKQIDRVSRVAKEAPAVGIDRVDPVAVAKAAAGRAETLRELAAELAGYDLCELRKGARSTVFADGNPMARVMLIGEAPGRDEDMAGRPFVGRAGLLLDQMFGAIGLSRGGQDRDAGLYITNVMPWRPPQNRDPQDEEIAMMQPFLARHVELVGPELIVVMGNTSLFAALGTRGITRARGQWAEAWGRPVLPMLHPAYLLHTPSAKREAWADLLTLKARLGNV